MSGHSAFEALIDQFRNKSIHAAHSGRELMQALQRFVLEGEFGSWDEMQTQLDLALEDLLTHMLAYAPPMNVLHSFLAVVEDIHAKDANLEALNAAVLDLADSYQAWSQQARSKIAEIAFQLIEDGSTIFTFTLSETVMTTFRQVWKRGKRFGVHITESRPNNDGLQTAAQLADLGVPVKVSLDACIPELMKDADLMMGGAEAIQVDGSAVCKTGTYLAALTAREFGVPFYILADTMKFDVSSMVGSRARFDSIRGEDFPDLASENDLHIAGHLFDCTPARYIRSVVTERGVIPPAACVEVMRNMPISDFLLQHLRSQAS
jgi:translation initiation factor 2B subunit (eIF-2B alpha/beta/delta family)